MIKLGVNSILFQTLGFADAAKTIKKCGYDGVEVSAIAGMCEHLHVTEWKTEKAEFRAISEELDLPFLSAELATQDRERLLTAYEACAEIGIPIVNIGPSGKMNNEADFNENVEKLNILAKDAEQFGVFLCMKAHVGSAVYNTPTMVKLMNQIESPNFGVDMDPSHIHRSGENPVEALPQVISRVKHIHIRDCLGRNTSPGEPANQACGRGDIDLFGYFNAMTDGKYDGPVCLEIIGPTQDVVSASIIAAESRGYMNACLKKLGAR